MTATWRRPGHLHALLGAVHRGDEFKVDAPFAIEHLVVFDGPDCDTVRPRWCEQVRYHALEEHKGSWGAAAKDRGIAEARGRYCIFWDDDNIYESHALVTAYVAAFGFDIGVVQVVHEGPLPAYGGRKNVTIPDRWSGTFEFGKVDTMCVCVRTEVARWAPWYDGDETRGTDYRWLKKLAHMGASIRFVPVVIGRKC